MAGVENRRMTDVLRPADLRILRSAASTSADGATVALVFATSDFAGLLLNWAVAAPALASLVVLVAMDDALHRQLTIRGATRPSCCCPRRLWRRQNQQNQRDRRAPAFGASVLAADCPSCTRMDAVAGRPDTAIRWRRRRQPHMGQAEIGRQRVGRGDVHRPTLCAPRARRSSWRAKYSRAWRRSGGARQLADERPVLLERRAPRARRRVARRQRMAGLDDFNGRMHAVAPRRRRQRRQPLATAEADDAAARLVPRACPVVKASDAATRAGATSSRCGSRC